MYTNKEGLLHKKSYKQTILAYGDNKIKFQ